MEEPMRAFVGLLFAAVAGYGQSAITPFSLVDVGQRFDENGKLISETRFRFARNGHGSIVSVDLEAGAAGARQIIDLTNGRSVLVDPNAKSATVTPYRGSMPGETGPCEARFYSMIGAKVSVDRNGGQVADIPVERITVAGPDDRVMHILAAPSLRCQMLGVTQSKGGRLLSRHVVEELRIGEPDVSLFDVPAEYRVSQPSLR
jgi:hypothetical protein